MHEYAFPQRLYSADPDVGRPTANCEATPRSASSARHLAATLPTWLPRRSADIARSPPTSLVSQRPSGSQGIYCEDSQIVDGYVNVTN
jgi:hypothetical protein